MIEALMGMARAGAGLGVLADVEDEDVGAAELQVDARLALLHGADHLGAEHALVEAGRRFRVAGEQVDMVEGEFGHVGCPLIGLGGTQSLSHAMAPQQLASETGAPVAPRSGVGYPGTNLATPDKEHTLGPQHLQGGARALP